MFQDRQLVGELPELLGGPGCVDCDDVIGQTSGLGLEVQHHVEPLTEGTSSVAEAIPACLHVQDHVVGGDLGAHGCGVAGSLGRWVAGLLGIWVAGSLGC